MADLIAGSILNRQQVIDRMDNSNCLRLGQFNFINYHVTQSFKILQADGRLDEAAKLSGELLEKYKDSKA